MLSGVSETRCARLVKVFIVVDLCEVGLSVGMRRFSVHCRSQFVVVAAYQTVLMRKFSILFDFFCKLDAGLLLAMLDFFFVRSSSST